MTKLILALTIFTAFHALPSTPLRAILIRVLGRPVFMALFSALSVLLFAWVWSAWRETQPAPLYWVTGPVLRAASAAVMLFAFALLVLAVCERRPVLLTGESVLQKTDAIRGALRVSRHPILWAIGLWGLVHMINNADPPSWLFFGYSAALAFGGTLLIDARRRRLLPREAWERLAAETSNAPFLAILQGRNRLVRGEFHLWKLALAALLWGLILHAHPHLFGPAIFAF